MAKKDSLSLVCCKLKRVLPFLGQSGSKKKKMQLLDLPIEIVKDIFEQIVFTLGLYQVVKIRLVCKIFDLEIENAISAMNFLNYRNYPRIAGIFYRHAGCVKHLSDLSVERRCKFPHGINLRFLTRYLYDRVMANSGHLSVTISQTVELLLRETGETSDSRRIEYTMELCKAAISNLDPSLVLDYSMKTHCCRQTATHTPKNSHHTLVAATHLGLMPLVSRLLAENSDGVSVNSVYFGYPLQVAAQGGHLDIMHTLLDYGMDINACYEVYGNILQRAAFAGHEDIVRLLLQPEFGCNILGDVFDEAILDAARGGHTKVANFLFGYMTTVRSYNLESIMVCEAARYGQENMVKEMLLKGAKIRREDRWHNDKIRLYASALGLASARGHTGVVKAILAHRKANKKPTDLRNFIKRVLRAILAARITSDEPTDEPTDEFTDESTDEFTDEFTDEPTELESAMKEAVSRGYKSTVKAFLDYGADINNKLNSPLKAASIYGMDEMLKFLLDQGMDPLADDRIAFNALSYASRYGSLRFLRILRSHGVDLKKRSCRNWVRAGLRRRMELRAKNFIPAPNDDYGIEEWRFGEARKYYLLCASTPRPYFREDCKKCTLYAGCERLDLTTNYEPERFDGLDWC